MSQISDLPAPALAWLGARHIFQWGHSGEGWAGAACLQRALIVAWLENEEQQSLSLRGARLVAGGRSMQQGAGVSGCCGRCSALHGEEPLLAWGAGASSRARRL